MTLYCCYYDCDGFMRGSQNLRKKSELLKVESLDSHRKVKAMLSRLWGLVEAMAAKARNATDECEDLRKKYQKEALQRKLLYNKIQEMRGKSVGYTYMYCIGGKR